MRQPKHQKIKKKIDSKLRLTSDTDFWMNPNFFDSMYSSKSKSILSIEFNLRNANTMRAWR
jgi:hypothetical protein